MTFYRENAALNFNFDILQKLNDVNLAWNVYFEFKTGVGKSTGECDLTFQVGVSQIEILMYSHNANFIKLHIVKFEENPQIFTYCEFIPLVRMKNIVYFLKIHLVRNSHQVNKFA